MTTGTGRHKRSPLSNRPSPTACAQDGRLPVSALARRLDRSESSVSRALERLVARGVLHFRTLVEPALLGYQAEFMVWLSIEPDQLDAAGRQLARHPGTKFLAAATGRFNLVGHMVLPRRTDLFRYTGEVIGALPGAPTPPTSPCTSPP